MALKGRIRLDVDLATSRERRRRYPFTTPHSSTGSGWGSCAGWPAIAC
jgi:hypothetical protein